MNLLKEIYNLHKKLRPDYFRNKLLKLIKNESTYGDYFWSYFRRPKSNISTKEGVEVCCSKRKSIAIVLQGPISHEDNYTLETIKFYINQNPDWKVIVSTWDNEDTLEIEQIGNSNLHILKNPILPNKGPNNINLQIFSSKIGIEKASELGCEYVFKSRTDQRIYNVNVDLYCLALMRHFPLDEEEAIKERIVACSFTSLKYRPYGVSDMLLFGCIDDMLYYWDIPYDQRISPPSFYEKISVLDHAKYRLGEVYIVTEFLKKIEYNIDWTLEDTWNVYAKFYLIIDKEAINLHWNKYDKEIEDRFKYYQDHSFELMEFKDWLLALNHTVKIQIDLKKTNYGSKADKKDFKK